MRMLTDAQATACETAKHPTCRCRCGGQFHGKNHAPLIEEERMARAKALALEGQLCAERLVAALPSEVAQARQQMPLNWD